MGTPPQIAEELTTARQLLRHTVATIAYRGGNALRNAPTTFADYRCGDSMRTPGQILAHLGDLLEWSTRMVQGDESVRAAWRPLPATTWNQDMDRFYAALSALDASLQGDRPLGISAAILFQGPISDVIHTHRPVGHAAAHVRRESEERSHGARRDCCWPRGPRTNIIAI